MAKGTFSDPIPMDSQKELEITAKEDALDKIIEKLT